MPGARDRLCWSHPHTAPHAAPLQIRARLGSKESGPGLGVANRRVLAPRRAGNGTGRFATPGDKSPPAITGGTCSSVETSQQCTGRARAPLSLRPAACRLEVGHGSGAANGAPRVASPSPGCGPSLVPSSWTGQLKGPSPGDRLGAAESVERAVRVGNGLDASVQIGIGQRAGHSRAQDMGRRNQRPVRRDSEAEACRQWNEQGQTRSKEVAGAADTTAAAGPAGLIRSQSRRAADAGTAGRRKQRPAGARSRDGAPAEAVGQPGHRQSATAQRCRGTGPCGTSLGQR
jgi:hypothetical protein